LNADPDANRHLEVDRSFSEKLQLLNTRFDTVMHSNRRNYVFSDGSRGNSAELAPAGSIVTTTGRNSPVGSVAHFNDLQQMESIMLAAFIDFYFTDHLSRREMRMVRVLFLAFGLSGFIGMFYADAFHEAFKPLKRVWVAERDDWRLHKLRGKVSVARLIIYNAALIIVFTIFVNIYSIMDLFTIY